MAKIIYTKHALEKFSTLSQHDFVLTKKNILLVIRKPNHIDMQTNRPNFIASKDFGKKHALRVVYKVKSAIIKVITFYPAET